MSRIGNKPIEIPAGIDVKVEGNTVTVSGKGITLSQTIDSRIGVKMDGNVMHITRANEEKETKSMHGLYRALIHNMVEGIEKGFSKELEINGVGYRAAKQGNELVMNLGYSHQVVVPEIPGITIEVPAGTYDWCIANPTPGDRIWIASAQGNIGGRADDYEFEAGYTYNFTVYLLGQNDATDVEIIPGGGETPVITDSPTPVITNSPTPEPPTDTPEPGDETPTPEIPTDAPTPEPPTDAPEPVTPAPGDVIFSVGGVHYVAAGSQVSVDLTIDGEYEANGMNIWVQYDAEKLTLNSVDEGEIMKAIKDLGGMNILDFQSIPGSVRLGSMLPRDPVSGSGKIFTMNFTVAEGLEDGTEMPIEILVKEFFNMPVGGENTPIAFFAENGSIVVGEAPVTEAPITDEPTAVPTDAPNPPVTGAMSLIGVGIAAIVASAGVVIFRKKEED